jgi:hypothetical protein
MTLISKSSCTNTIQKQKETSFLPDVLSFLSCEDHGIAMRVCKTWQQYGKSVSDEDFATEGYGDFILVDQTNGSISYEVFKKIFPILNDNLPQVHQQFLGGERLASINEEIQNYYPSLKAVFIPRALYELNFLLSTYREERDLAKNKQTCKEPCHSLILDTGDDRNNLDPRIILLAFRLNQFILKELGVTARGLTKIECQRAGYNILAQFQQMNKENSDPITDSGKRNCPYPLLYKIRKGMMIDPINLKKVISLEYDPKYEDTVILYRGSSFFMEPLYDPGQKEKQARVVCLGMSLFAGFMRDASACAGVHMFYCSDTVISYSLHVPLENNWQNVFVIPRLNTTCGLISSGEDFHPRAKCIRVKNKPITGYITFSEEGEEYAKKTFISSLPEKEIIKQLDSYQEQRIVYTIGSEKIRGSAPAY